ncbi:MAG: amidohydrolase [Chloroflexi bacterium]|nr:amidohydrolase [Chloroflexota bacterium]
MKIDVFTHLVPPKVADFMFRKDIRLLERLRNFPGLYDLSVRFRGMAKNPDVLQVLTVPGASVDDMVGPQEAPDLARRMNDELAELVFHYPDRFAAGVAVLSFRDIDTTLTEIDRAINDLKLRGILFRIPVNGKPVDRPEFMPIYEKMCQHNLPIWWHPASSPKKADYADETESKYMIWHLWGLIYETTISMTRLVFSGVLEKYPKLKIITHHCGAMTSFFSERIVSHYDQSEMREKMDIKAGLTEPHIDYFRRFYNDTALFGNTPALMCAHSFFGTDHILFGSDSPFDTQCGEWSTNRAVEAIQQMAIPDADKKKIFEDNARRLLRLAV